MFRKYAVLGALVLLAGCSAKVEAKAGNEGVSAEASYGSEQGAASGDDGTDPSEESDEAPGRMVEDHAFDDRSVATYPGFREFEDGSSRVFIELAGVIDIKERKEAGKLIYRFEGVDVPERVNTMSLPTMHFSTPVALVEVRKIDGAAELHVHLRQEVKPKTHLKQTQGGTVLSLDFPPYVPHAQDTRANVTSELQAADAQDDGGYAPKK